MKRIILLTIVLISLVYVGCENKLDIDPKSTLNEEQVSNPENIDNFVIAAYAPLGNGDINVSFSLWQYGDIRSDDAYKGGRDEGDGQEFHFMETFTNMRTDFWELDDLWYQLYIAVGRTNTALRLLDKVSEKDYSKKKERQGEMRFLRGYYYFMLKELWRNVPYIDETVPKDEYKNISNVALSNDSLWEKVCQDFKFAAKNLPVNQTDVGRPTQDAAFSFLAKARLFQAYKQDEEYNVIGIDKEDMRDVVDACDSVILSGKYRMVQHFGYNFLAGDHQNGPEAIFSIQFSRDDNTLYGRLNFGDALSVPQGIGCCDFDKPSQNLVNAFHTNSNGLPLLDDFNNQDLDLSTNTVDPRLGHTVAIDGHPWKYDTAYIYKDSWSRNPSVYGYYASLKQNVSPDDDSFVPTPPFFPNSKDKILMRYSEVLLMKAEALIELGEQDKALPLINEVRERAANSTLLLKDKFGNDLENYKVNTYQPGINCTWTQDFARKALRFERRLELAMESDRFFDLVRWGIAAETLNKYFSTEKAKRPFLSGAVFSQNKNEYLPIPQNQINFSKGLYKQNRGY